MQGGQRGKAVSRRQFGAMSAGLLASAVPLSACQTGTGAAPTARLTARPGAPGRALPAGTHLLGLDARRDAILHIPAAPAGPMPLLVLLHGAGGEAERILQRFRAAADAAGVALLAPYSRGSTWDAIRGRFGADVAFLDRALAASFERIAVDAARVAIGGFSDGASYALSLGLINGDLFPRIAAFSPGFVIGGAPVERPHCFVSHGTADDILPIDRCSRRIVADLRRRGYAVTYREFTGGHQVPDEIAIEGLRWVAAKATGLSLEPLVTPRG
jgi:predicted esterase